MSPEEAKEKFPKMFPDIEVGNKDLIWDLEDLLSWPRGTIYPQKTAWDRG